MDFIIKYLYILFLFKSQNIKQNQKKSIMKYFQ